MSIGPPGSLWLSRRGKVSASCRVPGHWLLSHESRSLTQAELSPRRRSRKAARTKDLKGAKAVAKNWVTAAQTTAASSRGLQTAPRFVRLTLRRPVGAGWGSGQHGTASTVHGCEGEWGGNVECLRFSFWGFGCYRKLQEMVRARSSEGHEPPKCWARCSCGQCSFFLLYFIHTPVGSLLPVHSRVKTGWLPGPVPSVRGRKLEKGRIEGETRGIERIALVVSSISRKSSQRARPA